MTPYHSPLLFKVLHLEKEIANNTNKIEKYWFFKDNHGITILSLYTALREFIKELSVSEKLLCLV